MAFEKKLESLMMIPSTVSANSFIKEAEKLTSETLSGNGALKYSTSGNDFVDQFASASRYKEPRSYKEISKDMHLLWSQDPLKTFKLTLYFRMITRKSNYLQNNKVKTTEETQRGQGLKHESIMRLMWIAINHPKIFKANIWLIVAAGSWKDIITMMNLDIQYHGWKNRVLDWNFFGNVIRAGLLNPSTVDLVKKYLPTIRTNKKCTTTESQADTIIGRWLAKILCPDCKDKIAAYSQYRKIKSSGTAHEWQQLISKQLYNNINFNTVAGIALAQLVGSKFLSNHNLEKAYEDWIMSKPLAKFTGYVHELFQPFEDNKSIKSYQDKTINAQFNQLVEKGKISNQSKLLVVRDTSASMTRKALGTKMSSFNIAKALALYFSEFLDGPFKNCFVEFHHKCRLLQWKGNTATEKWKNDKCSCVGNTNFLTIANLFAELKAKGIPESDFPTGVLALSDGEFDGTCEISTFKAFRSILDKAGFSKEYVENFKLILWDIPNDFYGKRKTTFEDFADAPNNFYMSGYDPAAIAFIMGNSYEKKAPKNAIELFEAAMNQELLNNIVIL